MTSLVQMQTASLGWWLRGFYDFNFNGWEEIKQTSRTRWRWDGNICTRATMTDARPLESRNTSNNEWDLRAACSCVHVQHSLVSSSSCDIFFWLKRNICCSRLSFIFPESRHARMLSPKNHKHASTVASPFKLTCPICRSIKAYISYKDPHSLNFFST